MLGLYLVKRILLTLPTLVGISLVCFFLIQTTPGGPIDQAIAQLQAKQSGEVGGSGRDYGITEEQRRSLAKYYGFDKPLYQRYFIWLSKVLRLDFGTSYSYEEPVWDVIMARLPVSTTFGVVSFILMYLISIPLGILKAIKHNSWFDNLSSGVIFFLYSIPNFAFAVLLIVLFCGGSFFNFFPISGFHSDNFESLSFFEQTADLISHMFLPLVCYVTGLFAVLTLLMKNSLLDQLGEDYIMTARAKGVSEKQIILKHALRNALLPIANGLGHALSIFFTGSFLIETIFNLQGIGRLSFESMISRDYPVVMANIMILSVLYVFGNIISDLLYMFIDPRIDFGKSTA